MKRKMNLVALGVVGLGVVGCAMFGFGNKNKVSTETVNNVMVSTPSNGGEEHQNERWVVDEPAWIDEWEVYENRQRIICDTCGADITRDCNQHMETGSCSGYHVEDYKELVSTTYEHHDEVGHWEEVEEN